MSFLDALLGSNNRTPPPDLPDKLKYSSVPALEKSTGAYYVCGRQGFLSTEKTGTLHPNVRNAWPFKTFLDADAAGKKHLGHTYFAILQVPHK